MKNYLKKIFFAVTILIFIPFVNTRADVISVSDSTSLIEVFSSGGEARLGNNITLDANTFVNGDTVLDLNGYTLTMKKTLVPKAEITIKDTSEDGTGKLTGTANYIMQVGTSAANGKLKLEGEYN